MPRYNGRDSPGNQNMATSVPTRRLLVQSGRNDGFYADAKLNGPGCTYATTAHEFTYHDYSTGFRCCADKIE